MDGENREFPLKGDCEIRHFPEIWINESSMIVDIGQGNRTLINNIYEVEPFQSEADTAPWKSENPELGQLLGTFTVIGDSIISVYESKDRVFSGAEFLLKLSDEQYLNRGFFKQGPVRIASWSVTLHRRAK